MNGLSDYSGEFNPDIRFEDFSKDFLVELLKLYSKLVLAIDGFWYLAIKERDSNEGAALCDMWAWEKEVKYEMNRLAKLLKIQGNAVVTLMKALQMSPWFQNLEYNIEIINKNNAVLTIAHCPTLEALEKEGEGRERTICKLVDAMIYKKYAEFFNPNMEVRHLKLPPRKSKEEICCQWEFKVR